jgi:hypothetical protein
MIRNLLARLHWRVAPELPKIVFGAVVDSPSGHLVRYFADRKGALLFVYSECRDRQLPLSENWAGDFVTIDDTTVGVYTMGI